MKKIKFQGIAIGDDVIAFLLPLFPEMQSQVIDDSFTLHLSTGIDVLTLSDRLDVVAQVYPAIAVSVVPSDPITLNEAKWQRIRALKKNMADLQRAGYRDTTENVTLPAEEKELQRFTMMYTELKESGRLDLDRDQIRLKNRALLDATVGRNKALIRRLGSWGRIKVDKYNSNYAAILAATTVSGVQAVPITM